MDANGAWRNNVFVERFWQFIKCEGSCTRRRLETRPGLPFTRRRTLFRRTEPALHRKPFDDGDIERAVGMAPCAERTVEGGRETMIAAGTHNSSSALMLGNSHDHVALPAPPRRKPMPDPVGSARVLQRAAYQASRATQWPKVRKEDDRGPSHPLESAVGPVWRRQTGVRMKDVKLVGTPAPC